MLLFLIIIPVLYRSGQKAFEFSPELRQRLRTYLMNGGTLILDSCAGSSDFAVSAMREIQQLIPERTPYRLAWDHPLYNAYYPIKNIRFRPYAKEAAARDNIPSIIGVDINTRTVVFFFRYDISSGWQGRPDTDEIKIVGYDIETAKLLGANLMAYITTERNAAVPLSRSLNFIDENKSTVGKFVFAQGKYNGLWKTREAGLNMLLNAFHEKTTTPVHFLTSEVSLDSQNLFDAPYVYLTGTIDFRFTPQERENLRRYVSRGGVIFAEAGCGRSSFDAAFRREIQGIIPETKLEPLSLNHLIFSFPNKINLVTPRPALARLLGVTDKIAPRIEGMTLNGQLVVIYSPFDLSGGWELAQAPYDLGIEPQDALNLGVNILTYIITH